MTEESRLNGELLSPSRVGDLNRSRVIQALCDHGPMSRAELAKLAGVSRATIGNIVSSLLESRLVEEQDASAGSGRVGKPARPVWFGPRAGLVAAVALGAGTLEAALVNARGEVLERTEGDFDVEDGRAVVAAARDALREVIADGDDLLGIGVAVPGVCNTTEGIVLGSGPIPGLEDTKLATELAAALDHSVVIDNDSRAQALGEKWFGQGKGEQRFASIQTGAGVGVGLVLDGRIYRGASGEAGEFGHTCVDRDGRKCRCGLVGCWETIASLGWLRAEAARRKISGGRRIDASKLARLAGEEDDALELLHDYADNIAIGLANLNQLLDPQLFILHGDAVGGGELLRSAIEARTRLRSLPNLASGVRVVVSELDELAAVLGAAALVLTETFDLSI